VIWWIGPAGAESDSGPGTDFHAVQNRRVSITPLLVDLTRFSVIDRLKSWLGDLGPVAAT
jgi:5'-nucleotidase